MKLKFALADRAAFVGSEQPLKPSPTMVQPLCDLRNC
jgi:hypothetical protein